jgi:hypothetical protein
MRGIFFPEIMRIRWSAITVSPDPSDQEMAERLRGLGC